MGDPRGVADASADAVSMKFPVNLAQLAGAAGASTDEPETGVEDASRKNLLLLVQLRWLAVGGQIATIIVVRLGLDIPLPIATMAAVLAVLVGLNIVSLGRLSRAAAVTNSELFAALLIDVGALTLQVFLTGGATNPFAFLYLLQVTLGAVLLDAWSSWMIVALTGLCFFGMTVVFRPLDLSSLPRESLFALHISGMLICFGLDAALLVLFLGQINGNLRQRDARLSALKQREVEEDHIVRIGLLASGAAHELGTPLSTLSVILSDWRRMPALAKDPDLMSEISAMDAEVKRCKAILTGILVSAGEARSESAMATSLHAFLDGLVEDWRAARSATTLVYERELPDVPVVSDTALRQVLFNVLDNAFEASAQWLCFQARHLSGQLVLTVSDAGPGFPPDIVEHVGRPYRSTKGRPGGGLGLFLVFNVVRKLGGSVAIGRRAEGGAVVTLTLPLAALTIEDPDVDGQ